MVVFEHLSVFVGTLANDVSISHTNFSATCTTTDEVALNDNQLDKLSHAFLFQWQFYSDHYASQCCMKITSRIAHVEGGRIVPLSLLTHEYRVPSVYISQQSINPKLIHKFHYFTYKNL